MRDEDPLFTGQKHSIKDYQNIADQKITYYVTPLLKDVKEETKESEFKEQFPEMVKMSKKSKIDYSKLLVDEKISEEEQN